MNYLTLENVSMTTKKMYTRSDPSVSDSPDSPRHFAALLITKTNPYLFPLAFHQVSGESFEDGNCQVMDPMLFHRESGSSLGSKAILHEILSIVRYSRDEGLQNPKSLPF